MRWDHSVDRDQSVALSRFDRDMSADIDLSSRPHTSCYSIAWDVVIPAILAAIPVGAFRLLGFVTQGLDKPEATTPQILIAAILMLQTIGIIVMAFVILSRFENAFSQLSTRTNHQPPAWRRLALMLSIACLLLTDILANVAAAFAGAGFLLVAAVPTFLGYLACKGIAFAGLSGRRNYAG